MRWFRVCWRSLSKFDRVWLKVKIKSGIWKIKYRNWKRWDFAFQFKSENYKFKFILGQETATRNHHRQFSCPFTGWTHCQQTPWSWSQSIIEGPKAACSRAQHPMAATTPRTEKWSTTQRFHSQENSILGNIKIQWTSKTRRGTNDN